MAEDTWCFEIIERPDGIGFTKKNVVSFAGTSKKNEGAAELVSVSSSTVRGHSLDLKVFNHRDATADNPERLALREYGELVKLNKAGASRGKAPLAFAYGKARRCSDDSAYPAILIQHIDGYVGLERTASNGKSHLRIPVRRAFTAMPPLGQSPSGGTDKSPAEKSGTNLGARASKPLRRFFTGASVSFKASTVCCMVLLCSCIALVCGIDNEAVLFAAKASSAGGCATCAVFCLYAAIELAALVAKRWLAHPLNPFGRRTARRARWRSALQFQNLTDAFILFGKEIRTVCLVALLHFAYFFASSWMMFRW